MLKSNFKISEEIMVEKQRREKDLDEWCSELSDDHQVNKQIKELKEKAENFKESTLTQKLVDIIIRRMEMIEQDMRDDAKNFDGKPFNGRTVAEYLGNQGAAIAALADTIKLLVKEFA